MNEKNINNIYDVDVSKLPKLSIYQLREVGHKVGVYLPTVHKKDELIRLITSIVEGNTPPHESNTTKGRPHKDVISPKDWNKLVGFDNQVIAFDPTMFNDVSSTWNMLSCKNNYEHGNISKQYTGIFKKATIGGCIFVGHLYDLDYNFFARAFDDLIPMKILRDGDLVEFNSLLLKGQTIPKVTSVVKINDTMYIPDLQRPKFDKMTALQPKNPIQFKQTISTKIPPIAYGQRVMVSGNNGSGKTQILEHIAQNAPDDCTVIFVALGEKPENKFNFTNENVEYVFTTFDNTPEQQHFLLGLALDRAKRLCELNKNVLLLISNLGVAMQNYRYYLLKAPDCNINCICEDVLQKTKIMLATAKSTNMGSITLFCEFSKEYPNEQVAQYFNDLDSLCNCHLIADRDELIKGELPLGQSINDIAYKIKTL